MFSNTHKTTMANKTFLKNQKRAMDRLILGISNGNGEEGNNHNKKKSRLWNITFSSFVYHSNDWTRNMKIDSKEMLMDEENVAIISWIFAM